MTNTTAVETLRKLIAAAENVNTEWKHDPDGFGTSDMGVAALMALQTTLPEARAMMAGLEKRKKK